MVCVKHTPSSESTVPRLQAGNAGKTGGAPPKKAEPASKKAPDIEPRPALTAPAKSKHGKKPQKDQQSANQALQLFSHLQQYRVRKSCCCR